MLALRAGELLRRRRNGSNCAAGVGEAVQVDGVADWFAEEDAANLCGRF